MIGFKREIDAEDGLHLRGAAALHELDRAIERVDICERQRGQLPLLRVRHNLVDRRHTG